MSGDSYEEMRKNLERWGLNASAMSVLQATYGSENQSGEVGAGLENLKLITAIYETSEVAPLYSDAMIDAAPSAGIGTQMLEENIRFANQMQNLSKPELWKVSELMKDPELRREDRQRSITQQAEQSMQFYQVTDAISTTVPRQIADRTEQLKNQRETSEREETIRNFERALGVQPTPTEPKPKWVAGPKNDYEFFLSFGSPKQVIDKLRFTEGYVPPNTRSSGRNWAKDEFATATGMEPSEEFDYLYERDNELISWIEDYVKRNPGERPDLEEYVEKAKKWLETTGMSIPKRNYSNTGALYNYIPPEADAFDVASLDTLKENLYSDEFFAGQGETLAMDNGTFGISDSTPDEASFYRNQDSVGEPGCTQAPNSTVEIESVNNIKLSLDEFERMFLKISKQESQTAIC